LQRSAGPDFGKGRSAAPFFKLFWTKAQGYLKAFAACKVHAANT
jgi:hypothetical protein